MFESLKQRIKPKKAAAQADTRSRAAQMIEILHSQSEDIRKKAEKPKEKKPLTDIFKLKFGEKKLNYPSFKIAQPRKFITLSDNFPVRYPLIEPYTYAVIRKDLMENVLVYNVNEPVLSDDEKKVLEKLKQGFVETINISPSSVKNEKELIAFLDEKVQSLINEYGFSLNQQQYLKIAYYIYRDFVGFNEIEPLLHDPFIEDIGADGVNSPIYVVHQKFGSLKTNITYHELDTLREFVVKLAERCDRYISYAEPLLDGSLPDGTRVQATLAPDVTTKGPTFSIRKFRKEPFTPTDLLLSKTASIELMAYLWYVIESRVNVLICGGTATGKTSFLNAISLFVPIEYKIVSIEDTREISLPHEHWIPGVSRVGFTGTKVGEVTMFDLLRESFRQNPDYLIVGEVRGEEAYVMFQGMASGHPSFSTIHAASLDDVVKRLESPPIKLSPSLIEVLDMVIVMVHAREKAKSARRVKEVMEVQGVDKDTGKASANRVFYWVPAEDAIEYGGYSWVLNKISITKGIPINEIYSEIETRKRVLTWMLRRNIRSLRDVAKYIVMFHKNKEKLLRLIGDEDLGEKMEIPIEADD
jgi:flagellar protein FlaI